MRRIILDTDLAMGAPVSEIDDGFALALAHADSDIAMDMITTVNGNTDVETATICTRELVRRLNIDDVKLVKGAAASLVRPHMVRTPAEATLELGQHTPPPTEGYAAAEIAHHVMAHPGEITIVAIGPLTNIAAALTLEPRLATNVAEIVVMGGIFFGTMPDRRLPGEFNVWTDPEAAATVLRSGAKQRWVGLDVTLQVRLTRSDAHRMLDAGTPFSAYAGESTLEWINHERGGLMPRHDEDADSSALHDPLAVAVVTRPDLVTFVDAHVEVVTGEGVARGVMVTDLLESAGAPRANCQVAVSVDVPAFREHLLTHITGL